MNGATQTPPAARPGGLRPRTDTLLVTVLFVALTAVMTWPHVTLLATHAVEHQDIYFNLWRLGWIAHALLRSPADLFDGNVFYPEPRTLTYSDAILVEGLFAAPLLWARLPPVLVHNLTMWAALLGSGTGIFVLTRELTGSRAAGIVAGIIFTFAPYRFDHYMHMEMQWALWTPWAFWAVHRTLATGTLRYGLLTGLFIALQMLSCIYYGIFLLTLLPAATVALLLGSRHVGLLRSARAFLPGAVIAALLCGAYAMPYLATKEQLGGRSDQEVLRFSARPSSYLIATPDNLLWGHRFAGRSRPERRLFPGALALTLGLAGLLLRRPGAAAIAYLLAGVMAFEMSLGFSGFMLPVLYKYLPVYEGLRAMARAGVFVLFFVAVLAAFGYAVVAAHLGRTGRRILAAVAVLILLAEYRVRPLALVPYTNTPPAPHAWLATQPQGVVVELPMAVPEALPGPDPRYSYLSIFHRKPLLNGYSGFHPPSYVDRAEALRAFPDDRAVARLRRDGARYVVVHYHEYHPATRAGMHDVLITRHRFREAARFPGGRADVVIYVVGG